MRHTLLTICALAFSGSAQAAPVLFDIEGEAFDLSQPIVSIDQAIAAASGRTADATFTPSGLDYPRGARKTVRSSNLLSQLIGVDAGTLSGDDIVLETSVFVFRGVIDLTGGIETFDVASDDGFALFIDGMEIGRQDRPRSYASTEIMGDFGIGLKTFALVTYENRGRMGFRLAINGEAAELRQTPLPPAAALMAGGAMLLLRRRRRF
jgi:hypothetical protein